MHETVKEWFTTHTFHGRDYTAEQVVTAKRGRTVSIVLPAKDEEETVGQIASAIRREYTGAVPLVDELVVIDSNSTDGTAAVAKDAGALVFAQREILPQMGNIPGKGEALWKSLAVTTGDVIVFVDSDLKDFDPHFVVGLLGPILVDGVSYIKGCYDRPLANGQTVHPAGGGRVTELVARPLLSAYWPDLTGFVQPLAGEYAGTRRVLESVPFASGYGVEIGMLIDVYEQFGLDAMGQVDLGVRVHRNSSDAALSKMALQIQLTMHQRLQDHDRIVTTDQPARRLTRFERPADGKGYTHDSHEVVSDERPPMITLQDYTASRLLV